MNIPLVSKTLKIELSDDIEQRNINTRFKDKIVTQIVTNCAYGKASTKLKILDLCRTQYHEAIMKAVVEELNKSGIDGSVFLNSDDVWCFEASSGFNIREPNIRVVEMSTGSRGATDNDNT